MALEKEDIVQQIKRLFDRLLRLLEIEKLELQFKQDVQASLSVDYPLLLLGVSRESAQMRLDVCWYAALGWKDRDILKKFWESRIVPKQVFRTNVSCIYKILNVADGERPNFGHLIIFMQNYLRRKRLLFYLSYRAEPPYEWWTDYIFKNNEQSSKTDVFYLIVYEPSNPEPITACIKTDDSEIPLLYDSSKGGFEINNGLHPSGIAKVVFTYELQDGAKEYYEMLIKIKSRDLNKGQDKKRDRRAISSALRTAPTQ